MTTNPLDLSVVIPASDAPANLPQLLPGLRSTLDALGVRYEILLVTRPGHLTTLAAAHGARLVSQPAPGYGVALRAGFAAATGAYILTVEPNLASGFDFVRALWAERCTAEVVIASRYVPGANPRMSALRHLLSRAMNAALGRGLTLRVHDFSSGFRLYKAAVLRAMPIEASGFESLQEILIRAHAEGWRIREIPFDYAARISARRRVVRFGLAYATSFWRLWHLRNSILSADYDDRAYDSPIPLQRYWQRSRFRHITGLVADQGATLDVGCGSSRIIGALPPGSIALDVLLRKLRYARKFGVPVVHGSGFRLPFADAQFPCVVCSQVIEHVPMDSPILDELVRVLAPGGRLVLGTPDYSRWEWVTLEKLYGFFAPGGYADEHITHYTRDSLVALFAQRGFTLEATHYILNGELILAFRKPPAAG